MSTLVVVLLVLGGIGAAIALVIFLGEKALELLGKVLRGG